MQRKRQLLEVSLAQISQIAKTLQENQGATEKLYEAQLKQEQQLEEANKVIQKKKLTSVSLKRILRVWKINLKPLITRTVS